MRIGTKKGTIWGADNEEGECCRGKGQEWAQTNTIKLQAADSRDAFAKQAQCFEFGK